MNHLARLRGQKISADGDISFDQWQSYFNFNGLTYPILQQTLVGGGKRQEMPPTYTGLSNLALKGNGTIWSCWAARNLVFSEVQFKFRPLNSFAPWDLFGGAALGLLEKPWFRATTSQLLRQWDSDQQLAGNSYAWREDSGTLRVARPDHMTIVLGSRKAMSNPDAYPDFAVGDIDTEIIGYIYRPPTGNAKALLPEQVAHWNQHPDPVFPFRGMSWLQPVIQEIQADSAATTHKLAFFENGATPNMVVTLDPSIQKAAFDEWVEAFEDGHKTALNAYKTIYLAGGADAKVVGSDLRQMDFKVTQSHGEVRICNAARIPPIIAGVSEGLDSGTYANFGQAKRLWADGTLRPLWRGATEALATIIDEPPAGAALWYDDRNVQFLADDQKDAAEIQQQRAATMKSLIDAGFQPNTVVAAVQSGDMTKLVHTGLYSVQLQPPGTMFQSSAPPAPAAPPKRPAAPAKKNGNGNGRAAPAPK